MGSDTSDSEATDKSWMVEEASQDGGASEDDNSQSESELVVDATPSPVKPAAVTAETIVDQFNIAKDADEHKPNPDDPKKRAVIVNKKRMQLAGPGKKAKWLQGPFPKCGSLGELLFNANSSKGGFLKPVANFEKDLIEFETVSNQQVRDLMRDFLNVDGSKEDLKCAARQYMSEKNVDESIFETLFPSANKRQRDAAASADTSKSKRAKPAVDAAPADTSKAGPADAPPAKVNKVPNKLGFEKQKQNGLKPRNLAADPNFDYEKKPRPGRSPKVSTPLRQLEEDLETRGIESLLDSPGGTETRYQTEEDASNAAMQQAITSVRLILEINPRVINATFQKALKAFVASETLDANVQTAQNLSGVTASLNAK